MRHFPIGTGYAPNYDIDNGAVNDGPEIVETRGYMTLKQQIDRALAAGVLHETWRREHFPPDFDVPDDYEPPAYAPDEQELLQEYQLMVDGRSRAMARLEAEQRRVESETESEPEPVKNPNPPAEEPPGE